VLASLRRSGSRRIPATSADGYSRYIAESVVNADFTEAKRNRLDAKKKMLHSDYCRYTMYGKLPGSIFELFQIM